MVEWVTIADSDTYFSTRAGDANIIWPTLTDAVKQTYLTTAYNRIYYDSQWNIPTTPTATQEEKLEKAQLELAWYFYIHINDEDRRKGIQAQGVIKADIVGEVYEKEYLKKNPYPPFVIAILDEFDTEYSYDLTEIGRDENKDINDVTVID